MNEINQTFELLNNSVSPFVKSGKTYCIGLSGGSDSVLLLHFLQKLRLDKHFHIIALHLNHSLRNNESNGDAAFCEKVCKKLNIEFISKKVDIKKLAGENKLSIEDAARKCRYKWFAEICEKRRADAVFIAHHADDQAETVLLRLFRGAGLKGLAGIKKTTFFGKLKIVRPWLDVPRKILDSTILKIKLEYRYDSSNSDTHFDRNWLRHNLIPVLNEHFKSDVKERLVRTSAISNEAYDFILKQSKEALCKYSRRSLLGFLFPLDVFKELHPAVQNTVLMLMLEENYSEPIQFSYNSIIKLRKFTLSSLLHCPLQFPGTISIGKAYNHFFVGKKADLEIKNAKIKIGDAFTTKSGLTISIEPVGHRSESISNNGEIWEKFVLGYKTEMIQYTSVPKTSVFNIRSRKAGDRYTPIHGKESKIKDLLITAHIPQQLKDAIPIIELNYEMVWLSGWRIANKFRVSDMQAETQDIVIRVKC